MISHDEKDAIQLCQQHKDEGLIWLIHHYQTQAMKIAYLITGNYVDAEDIVQDSFVHVWKSIHRFRPQFPFGPWFMRIVVNTTRMHQRTLSRHPVMSLDYIDAHDGLAERSAADPATLSEQNELSREMLQAITMLTPWQREAIVLHYYSGYPASDIAQIVGCRPDAARRRIHDGLVALERILTQHSSWLKETYR